MKAKVEAPQDISERIQAIIGLLSGAFQALSRTMPFPNHSYTYIKQLPSRPYLRSSSIWTIASSTGKGIVPNLGGSWSGQPSRRERLLKQPPVSFTCDGHHTIYSRFVIYIHKSMYIHINQLIKISIRISIHIRYNRSFIKNLHQCIRTDLLQ